MAANQTKLERFEPGDIDVVLFDLDGTLCKGGEHGAYDKAVPIPSRIERVRKEYDAGHYVIIETARGSGTDTNWYDLTNKQLRAWGVPYHELRTGVKIWADVYVDDRAVWDRDFFGDM